MSFRYDSYDYRDMGITKGEYNRLCVAVDDGIIPESIAFSRKNISSFKYGALKVDDLIRAWSGSSYVDPFLDVEIDINQDEFENIIHDVVDMMSHNIKEYEISGTNVRVAFFTNSRKGSWWANFDFDDDGQITGYCRFNSPNFSQSAGLPQSFARNVHALIRRLADN